MDRYGHLHHSHNLLTTCIHIVVTLTLGSRPRQGLARVQAKKEAWDSHLMLSGVQKSVREWTLTLLSELSYWEFVATLLWPSVGWSPTLGKSEDLESFGTPECLELDNKARNTLHWGVLDVIGKVLKRRYRKWPRIGHLNIYSPSYGQKKGRESNWQFDSWPLKVGNRPLPDIRFKNATRLWKDLDKGYKFGSDLVAIRLCSRELWAPKVPGLHPGQFRDSNPEIPGKSDIRAWVPPRVTEYTIGSKVVAYSRVRAVVCFVVQSARGLSQHLRVSRNVN